MGEDAGFRATHQTAVGTVVQAVKVTLVNLSCTTVAGPTQSGEEEKDWGQDGSWFLA